MPTFGQVADYPGFSASSADKTAVSPAVPASSGTVDTAVARIWMTAGSTTAKFCIYANSAGTPGAKLAESDPLTVSNTGEQEILFTFSGGNRINVTEGTTYHIGPSWQDPGADSLNISRNSVAAGRREVQAYAPNPFGTATSLTGPIDAYVNYLLPAPVETVDGSFFDFFDSYLVADSTGVLALVNAGQVDIDTIGA